MHVDIRFIYLPALSVKRLVTLCFLSFPSVYFVSFDRHISIVTGSAVCTLCEGFTIKVHDVLQNLITIRTNMNATENLTATPAFTDAERLIAASSYSMMA